MFDLLIRGDRVVTPHGVGPWEIAVKDGVIAALGARGTFAAAQAARVIDAGAGIVMPGGIDPHVHCAWYMPAFRPGEPSGLSGPPEQVSRAALWGGTTTLIDFAACKPDREGDESSSQGLREALEARDREFAGRCYCDYAYHIMLRGRVPPSTIAELAEAVQAGYPTVKIFTTDITPSRRGRMIRFGDLWEIFKVAARAGGLGVIHAEDNDIVMHMYEKLFAENRTGFERMAEVHNTLSEDLSFRRIIRLAENVDGMALYMMHVSAAAGVQAIAESRARGFPIYGETLHQYLLYTSEDYRRPNGQIYHTYPSLKSRRDQERLWDGLARGDLHCVATDEVCCKLAVKVQGRRIDDTTGGNSGVEPRVAVMYTETVEKRGYPLEKFVDVVSANAARILGLYPRKGAIAVGSDADITVLDTNQRRTVRAQDLHESDYTPWEGKDVGAWPELTVLRGKVMVADGQFHGDLKDGQYLKRRIPDDIRARRNANSDSGA
jgi:dihydropyrimidinase